MFLERETKMENSPSSESLNLDTMRSRICELEEMYRNCNEDSFSEMSSPDSDELMRDCVLSLESKVNKILTECSDFSFLGIDDLDAYLAHLKEELSEAEAENLRISNEIEVLDRTYMEDSSELESELEQMKCSLDLISLQQELEKENGAISMECSSCREDESNLKQTHEEDRFEILKLDNRIEKSKTILKPMQSLDTIFKRFDAIEQIEDALSGLKVVEFDGSCIRLSLQTYMPKVEDLLLQQKIEETVEASEINHEFLIEVISETMEIKKVEMFPSDIYIADIVDGAKAFRQLFSQLTLMETRSSLEWFIRKAQDRIIQCTLRRLVVKSASTSRQSFEYLDRDETIVAHLIGGIDALIKVCQGWPILNSPLKLISLKSSNHHSSKISLAFLCKVEEVVNSLEVHTRQNLSSFVDAVEKVLVEEMHLELQSDGTPKI